MGKIEGSCEKMGLRFENAYEMVKKILNSIFSFFDVSHVYTKCPTKQFSFEACFLMYKDRSQHS